LLHVVFDQEENIDYPDRSLFVPSDQLTSSRESVRKRAHSKKATPEFPLLADWSENYVNPQFINAGA
jgi:hypothetical protein